MFAQLVTTVVCIIFVDFIIKIMLIHIHSESKKCAIVHSFITLTNVGRFSIFFSPLYSP